MRGNERKGGGREGEEEIRKEKTVKAEKRSIGGVGKKMKGKKERWG